MSQMCMKWGVAARPFPGEVVSGDKFYVKANNPYTLLSLIDGLGHGQVAAKAADSAICVLEEYYEHPLREIIKLAHEQLRSTRGVAMCLVSFNGKSNSISWTGVGDIRGKLVRHKASKDYPHKSLSMVIGVVGYRLHTVREDSCQVQEQDLLILTTDGISRFNLGYISEDVQPESLAKDILAKHGKETDDATVLVARFGRCT